MNGFNEASTLEMEEVNGGIVKIVVAVVVIVATTLIAPAVAHAPAVPANNPVKRDGNGKVIGL